MSDPTAIIEEIDGGDAMAGTDFLTRCKILGDLWLHYREDARDSEAWERFFEYNDISLPLAYMIGSGIASASGDGQAETYINENFEMLCSFIEIDPEGHYSSLNEAWDASPLPSVGEEEENEH
jgi:hypothetical protein